MAVTAYCRKCRKDVEPGETCPECGGKLTKSSLRVAYCTEHRPVADWMCWNGVARIVLPAYGVVLALILVLEGLSGGGAAVERLLRNGLLISLLMLLIVTTLIVLVLLILQGTDLFDCVVDSRGVHVQQYLVDPTPVKLLLRFRSPGLMRQADTSTQPAVLLIAQKELAWRDVARVQLWPEKTTVLLYAPAWWMRLPLICTPFSYPDVLDYMRDKVGRKKNLLLPRELIAPPKPRAAKAAKQPAAPAQDAAAPLPVADAYPGDAYPADAYPDDAYPDDAYPDDAYPDDAYPDDAYMGYPPVQDEQAEDFMPLADVLAEIKDREQE